MDFCITDIFFQRKTGIAPWDSFSEVGKAQSEGSFCFLINICDMIGAIGFLTGWPSVGNEGINLYIGILGMKLPSFLTKGQLVKGGW